MVLKIEKNIPIPPKTRKYGGFKEALMKMEIGDSVLTEFTRSPQVSARLGKLPPFKFTTRKCKETGLIRVWRIE